MNLLLRVTSLSVLIYMIVLWVLEIQENDMFLDKNTVTCLAVLTGCCFLFYIAATAKMGQVLIACLGAVAAIVFLYTLFQVVDWDALWTLLWMSVAALTCLAGIFIDEVGDGYRYLRARRQKRHGSPNHNGGQPSYQQS